MLRKAKTGFNIRYYDELPFEEISKILDMSSEVLVKQTTIMPKKNRKLHQRKPRNLAKPIKIEVMKEFDLDKLERKTLYKVPENFFEEMQANMLKQTTNKEKKKPKF